VKKTVVGLVLFLATVLVPSGVAHADKPLTCVWPYVGNGNGLCIYLPTK